MPSKLIPAMRTSKRRTSRFFPALLLSRKGKTVKTSVLIFPSSSKKKKHTCGRIFLPLFLCSVLERQFQNFSKLSKRPRFDLRKGAFSAVTLQVAASNYPLQLFAMPSLPFFELLLKLPLEKSSLGMYLNKNPYLKRKKEVPIRYFLFFFLFYTRRFLSVSGSKKCITFDSKVT